MKFSPLIYTFIFVITSTFSYSQNTLLFKITGKDLKQPSYAFGTMHVNDEKAFNFGDAVFDAIEACDVAAFEIDMSNANSSELKEQIQGDSEFVNLFEYIKSELPKKLDSNFNKQAFAMKIMKLLPVFKTKMYDKESDMGARTQHVDAFLESYAMHKGKTIHGIETLTEQLHILLDFDKDIILQGIANFLLRPDWDSLVLDYFDNTEKLKNQYASLNLDSVCSEFYEANYSVDFIERLLDKRNVNMVERTLPIMRTKPVFIAVGAGHLCGKKGILALLKDKGYTITPIDITHKNSTPVTFTWIKNEMSEEGIKVETANVKFSPGKYERQYIASDTNRKGLIHFELRHEYNLEMDMLEGYLTWEEEEYDGDGYAEDIEIEEIEVAYDTVEAELEDDFDENEEVEYGDDNIGDAVFEEEIEATQYTAPNAEFITSMQKNMANFRIVEKVDTLHVNGKMGKIEVLKKNYAGRLTYHAKFLSNKDEDKIWNLTISGDPLLMNNEAVLRYFTSFEFTKPK